MIHHVFRALPDPEVAAACSEIFVDDDTYLLGAFDDTNEALERSTAAYFLDPHIQTLGVLATYWQGQPEQPQVVTKFNGFGRNIEEPSAVCRRYREDIGGLIGQSMMELRMLQMFPEFEGGADSLAEWFAKQVAAENHNLMVAYFVSHDAEANQLMDFLLYPKSVQATLGRMMQGFLTQHMEQLSPEMQADIQEFVQPDLNWTGKLGPLLAATQLLMPEQFDQQLYAYVRGSEES